MRLLAASRYVAFRAAGTADASNCDARLGRGRLPVGDASSLMRSVTWASVAGGRLYEAAGAARQNNYAAQRARRNGRSARLTGRCEYRRAAASYG
jgi:hypothetical protein